MHRGADPRTVVAHSSLPRAPESARPPRPRASNRAGVSLKTQELYALVFITRYLDLFFRFISLYAAPRARGWTPPRARTAD